MKLFSTLLLAVSLALNVVIVALFLSGHNPPANAPVTEPATTVGTTSGPVVDTEAWHDLNSDDLPTLVSHLRASGFPPAVIRGILAAQLEEQIAARRKALLAGAENIPFWKNPPNDPRLQPALRQLDVELQQRLRELLGEGDNDDPYSRAMDASLSFLPPDKVKEIRELRRNFDERRGNLLSGGTNYNTDRAVFTALDKELRESVARKLTPEEFFEYEVRTSQTASMLRDQLSAFDPTEDEFRSIYKLRAAFAARYGEDPFTLPPEQRPEYEKASSQVSKDIEALFSPERMAEYKRATDYNYRRTSQLVARLELPPETTNTLWDVKSEFQKRRSDMLRATPDPAQQRQQSTVLEQEAVARLTSIFGDAQHVEAYKQYGGSWLQNLAPRPAPTTLTPVSR